MNDERQHIRTDYVIGLLSPQQIAAKYRVSLRELQQMVKVGDGTTNAPIEWKPANLPARQMVNKEHKEIASIVRLARLPDKDLHLPPIEAVEQVDPHVRDSALTLAGAELEFSNAVLRGASPKYAAMMAFRIDNSDLAVHRADEMMKAPRVRAYLKAVGDYQCVAIQRDRAWLESVIIKVIDRSMEMTQEYDTFGIPIEGKCSYNPGIAIAAAALLSKMKGWDKAVGNDQAESFADKVKRLSLQKHRTIEHVADSEED